MSILGLLIAVFLIALCLWAMKTLVPDMDDRLYRVIIVIAVVACILMALNAFGLINLPVRLS